MTIEDIKKAIEDITKYSDDPERAHVLEDELYTTFIQSLANGEIKTIEEAKQMATEIVKVLDLDFPRWYA